MATTVSAATVPATTDSAVEPPAIEQDDKGVTLRLHVQPRARDDRFSGLHGDALKIRITAPPVDGRANRHLITLFAGWFGVPRDRVTLISGSSGRSKRLRIEQPDHYPDLFEKLLAGQPAD